MEENGKLVQFIFNTNREVISEKETQWTNYIRGSTLLASSTEHARTCYHYASDEMDSITHIVDGEKVLNEYEYDAWGEVVSSKETVANRFKFNGQQLDPITQQYYLRARFYNPVIARFTQEDTYRGDGLNLYAYCRNNPVYYVDPTGHNPNCIKEAYDAIKKANPNMSDADAYRQAYKDHAVNKLSDPNLSPKERAKIVARQARLKDQPSNPQVDIPQREHKIRLEILAEENAHRRLQELEASNTNSHFLSRHGAQNSLQSQLDRVQYGIDPGTGNITLKRNGNIVIPPSATRFFSHRDQLNLINKARQIFKNTGSNELNNKPITSPYIIGSGYDQNLKYGVTSTGIVRLDEQGIVITAYPVYGG